MPETEQDDLQQAIERLRTRYADRYLHGGLPAVLDAVAHNHLYDEAHDGVPAATPADRADALAAIAEVRRMVDRWERQLIEDARGDGMAWSRVAALLGLRSRQAAEQRLHRLAGATLNRPRDADGMRRLLKAVRDREASTGD
ncbi:hypothetical protein [Nocardiopsis potens]|uniref:hypothetical protein n=1 Tax=Nocardiopsis potens TaxID=1246458 RepID=UPI0003485E7B|nr:hypothetical protein [Nocardiopsis potens]